MRKLAANYIVSDSGKFLKNGILLAHEDGTALEFIDTKGNLDEIAQLTFHNGIVIPGNTFHRINLERTFPQPEGSFICSLVAGIEQISLHNLVEIGKQIQAQFPEMKIPEIMDSLNSVLDSQFRKERTPGIFLLVGSDLPGLHFTHKSRLKKIL
jgi:hypothetical protein